MKKTIKPKGENMEQEKNKHKLQEVAKLHEVAFDISVAIATFARGELTVESDLQEAKSSAKNLIEKIDEYLETLKPKFEVGDYVVELDRFITKIEKNDDGMLKGCFYMTENKHFSNIKDIISVSKARHATTEEIAEYESALTFHKRGRKPFDVKDGDLLENKFGKYIAHKSLFVKENFTVEGHAFLKTAEELDEWLENK